MLYLAFSRPSPPPLAPFHGQKQNSFNLATSRRHITPTHNSIIVPSDLFKPRKLNVAFASRIAVDYSDINDEDDDENGEDEEEIRNIALLRESLKPELMPKHVALFPDGHRRWAKERNLPFQAGYFGVIKPWEQLIQLCRQLQIPVVSIFSLSTGNYSLRPQEHIDFFNKYLEVGLDDYFMKICMRYDMRISLIGNTAAFPKSGQEAIKRAEEATRNNKGLHIVSLLNYDGRYDITQACKVVADKAKNGLIQPEEIDDKMFEEQLLTNCVDDYPNPDLFIRTGGKKRVSNYMLWQMAYSEMVFLDKYHPDIREADYIRIFSDFQKRERRFGG